MQSIQKNNIVVLGLDPGISNFGWAVYGKNVCLSGVIVPPERYLEDAEKISFIVEEITAIVNTYNVEDVAIEKILLGKPMPSVILGYAARMAVLASLVPHGILVANEYHTVSTKKTLLSNYRANKKEMIEAIMRWFDLKFKIKEHEADSYAQIAMYLLEYKIDCDVYKRIKGEIGDGKGVNKHSVEK
jgi:Holliday junction resolvasome RuvABC endonuclease subunit